jgi:hypothetical protein
VLLHHKKLIVPKPTNLFLQVIKNTYYIIVLCDDIHNHSTPILVSELMNIGACLSILGTITNLQHSFQHTPHLCLSIVQMTNSNLPISILKIISESNLRGEFLRDSHTTTKMWLLLFYLHERIVHQTTNTNYDAKSMHTSLSFLERKVVIDYKSYVSIHTPFTTNPSWTYIQLTWRNCTLLPSSSLLV